MKVRKIIITPKFSTYFKFEFKYTAHADNFYYNTQFFNKFMFFTVFTVVSLILGFFKPLFWAVALSNISLLSFLYFKTRKLAQGISISRKAPSFARERNKIKLRYHVINETGFKLRNLYFIENFDGVQDGLFFVDANRGVASQTQFFFNHEITLNAGMGIKTFSPIKYGITDELGIFDFEIHFSETDKIEVYPMMEETPLLKASISPDAIDFGFYEINKRGDSNLFIGTREYRHGDPVKHINWRLTKKTGKVIINEYEKNTNTFVSILIDLDLIHQLGFGETSTWEGAKDLALSISSNELARNNHVQILSNDFHIPFGTGKGHFNSIEKHLTLHQLKVAEGTKHLMHLHDIPERGQVYFICPLLSSPRMSEIYQFLLKLKMNGQAVSILTLDPYQELNSKIKGDIKIAVMEVERIAREVYKSRELELLAVSIPYYNLVVKKGQKFNKQLLKKAKENLERI